MNYILPNFFDSFPQNQELASTFMVYFDINMIQGTYPFSIFNGGCNNISSEIIALYADIKKCPEDYKNLSGRVLLDFGSTLINKKDYHNNYGKVILEEYCDNPKFYFEIGLIDFLDYLIFMYPNIQIILHQNYINNHDENEIQEIINNYSKNIKGIIITEAQPCLHVKNIEKFYLLQLNKCERCKQYKACVEYEMKNTLLYSKDSNFNFCEHIQLKTAEELSKEKEYVENILNCNNILFSTIPTNEEVKYYELIYGFFIKEAEKIKEDNTND